jgi:2-keto-3-deoxy-L-rhamnonate aldolase RhmA
MAKMRENKAKRKLDHGEVVTMLMGAHNSPDMIDFMGQFGFDSILIEGEHGPVDFGHVSDLSRACDLWGMTSIVRVNLNLPGVIYRTFDLGAQGIMVPHVDTIEDACAVVDASKFGPIGHRGAAGGRQSYGVENYVQTANDETLITVLIEDIVAIDNLEEIVTVEHIDVFYVAPGDLAQSMGLTGQTTHPDVQSAVERGIATIVGSGKTAGMLVNDSTVDAYLSKGVRFVGIPWSPWLASGARSFLDKLA